MVTDVSYLLTPFLAWFFTGIIKFLVNCVKEKRLAFDLVGYGGMPSNHSSIVTSSTVIVMLKEGVDHPAVVIGLALSFIVVLDAHSLRKQVELHAKKLNRLRLEDEAYTVLRERIGHSKKEIIVGAVTGAVTALVVYSTL